MKLHIGHRQALAFFAAGSLCSSFVLGSAFVFSPSLQSTVLTVSNGMESDMETDAASTTSAAASSCPDGYCDSSAGEDCSTCSMDCGSCPVVTSSSSSTTSSSCNGNGFCDGSETCSSCPGDCGACISSSSPTTTVPPVAPPTPPTTPPGPPPATPPGPPPTTPPDPSNAPAGPPAEVPPTDPPTDTPPAFAPSDNNNPAANGQDDGDGETEAGPSGNEAPEAPSPESSSEDEEREAGVFNDVGRDTAAAPSAPRPPAPAPQSIGATISSFLADFFGGASETTPAALPSGPVDNMELPVIPGEQPSEEDRAPGERTQDEVVEKLNVIDDMLTERMEAEKAVEGGAGRPSDDEEDVAGYVAEEAPAAEPPEPPADDLFGVISNSIGAAVSNLLGSILSLLK